MLKELIKQELINTTYDSFKNIYLKDSIGFYEADSIDDYLNGDVPVHIRWENYDERDNWERLLPLLSCAIHAERIRTGNWFFYGCKGKTVYITLH